MKPRPYIGITGFKKLDEVSQVAKQFIDKTYLPIGNDLITIYLPMFGFLCSYKKLADKNEHGRQSPRANDLGRLTSATPKGIIPMIHYHTINRNKLAEEVKEVFSIDKMYENDFCKALQINMPWPEVDEVSKIMKEFPGMDIVLQLPRTTLDDISRIKEYNGLVKYCLVDPSGGMGQKINDEKIELTKTIQKEMPDVRIGIAGGLCGNNVEEIIDQTYKVLGEEFCIDAQGKLRSGDKYFLELDKTKKYINKSVDAIKNRFA